ncbi:MAG: hypothetical protein K8S21_04455 [Gemmatimonadetes bacterium]|nr:hypothetical protein [Gemmatimonadota bacterium]
MDMEKMAASLSASRTAVSRRALVKAGWVVPVVLAVGIPRNALAQTGSDAGVLIDPGQDT